MLQPVTPCKGRVGHEVSSILARAYNALLVVVKKTFTPFGVPGCKPEATLVPETGVAAAQHIYSFQAKPVPTWPAIPSSEKPGIELPTDAWEYLLWYLHSWRCLAYLKTAVMRYGRPNWNVAQADHTDKPHCKSVQNLLGEITTCKQAANITKANSG